LIGLGGNDMGSDLGVRRWSGSSMKGYKNQWWIMNHEPWMRMPKDSVYLWFSQRQEPRERMMNGWRGRVKHREFDSTQEIAIGFFGDFWPCCQQNGEEISDVMPDSTILADSQLAQEMNIHEIRWHLSHYSFLQKPLLSEMCNNEIHNPSMLHSVASKSDWQFGPTTNDLNEWKNLDSVKWWTFIEARGLAQFAIRWTDYLFAWLAREEIHLPNGDNKCRDLKFAKLWKYVKERNGW
jgi:hypothetical protein